MKSRLEIFIVGDKFVGADQQNHNQSTEMKTITDKLRSPALALALAITGSYGFLPSAMSQAIGFVDYASRPLNTNLATSVSLFDGNVTITAHTLIDKNNPLTLPPVGQTGAISSEAGKSPFEGGFGVQTDDGSGSGQALSGDKSYEIDFGRIAGLALDANVTSFTIRETKDQIDVKAFAAGVVPGPSSVALIFSAYGIMMIFRRRSRR